MVARLVHAEQGLLPALFHRIWPKLRPWLPLLVAVVLLYLLFSAVNIHTLASAAKQFDLLYLLPMCAVYLVYLALRAMRWHLLMKPLSVPNSAVDSLLLFAAAQSALLVPAGQFLLPVLQKCQHGTLIRRSAATVVVQELIFGVLVLPAAAPGLLHNHTGDAIVAAAFVVSAVAGAAVLHNGVANLGIAVLGRLPFLRNHVAGFRDLREHVVLVVNTREAVLGSVLDMVAVAAAATSLYIALAGLGMARVGWPGALAAYALGNAAANVSSLPGGLGATEDTSTAVLVQLGLAAGPAAAGVLIYRAATLLLGTAVGWAVLLLCRNRFKVGPSLKGILSAANRRADEVEGASELLHLKSDAVGVKEADRV